MSSRDFGLGPKWWQQPDNKLQKCSERFTEWCDPTETDGCCAIIPCMYCLELEIYGEETQRGDTEFGMIGWEGSVGGGSFFGFWEVGYESGKCEFVVQWNGEEVYRKSCDDGQSCRDSSDEASVEVDYQDATLRWNKHEYLPLPYVRDEESECTVHYCDDCECTCEELCVAVSEVLPFGEGYDDFNDTYGGEISNVSYPCLPPVWQGIVGNFDLSLALGSDSYGHCIITPTVNGQEQAEIIAPGCTDLSATITLEDGSTISVSCKKCSCGTTIGDCICGRPLGPTLTLLWSSANGTHGNAPREFELSYGMTSAPGIVCDPYPIGGPFPAYTGSASGTFPMPMGGTKSDTLYVMMVCCIGCPTCVYYRWQGTMDIGDDTWNLTYILEQDCNCPAILSVDTFANNDTWGYQISDITIFENESNC